jgi:hypothetical protein
MNPQTERNRAPIAYSTRLSIAKTNSIANVGKVGEPDLFKTISIDNDFIPVWGL